MSNSGWMNKTAPLAGVAGGACVSSVARSLRHARTFALRVKARATVGAASARFTRQCGMSGYAGARAIHLP